MYKIILHKRPANFYTRLDKKQRERIGKAIDKLKENPLQGRNIKRLKGELEGKYRLRVGPFRIVYIVDKSKNLIVIESIGSRGSVY
ncbi:MAG TPA: type II toxin-antitoxin system RelE/ParE family toxin [Candidatus Aerophobetes bacterium]|uniref:Type II toxin-antitoxin system RelE/ParE family toxin n=1 Tax=Aerophobetes bacterium TaxID=2030807 RepID=A0A7V5I023_UNCAE|nr:type II toxin-antitoxin system RelE/ParE family toxin [Candidatus Aerophobetes bacterium]